MSARARLLLLLLVAFFLWSSLSYWSFVVDDAWISLRYARNLVEGRGLVYNAGQHVEGYSNFLWVLLGAFALATGLPAVVALKLVGMLAGVGMILGTHALARRAFEGSPKGPWLVALATAFVGLHASVAIWAQGGLETTLFAFLVLATAVCLERELAGERAFPLSAIAFGLAWMTRPDGMVYALYVALRRWRAARERGGLDREDARWALVALALIAPYEIWGYAYYGRLLPMTHAAKAGGLEDFLRQTLLFQFLTQQGVGLVVLLALALTGALLARRRPPVGAALVVLCGLVFVLYARKDWMPRHRFFVPLLPFLGILIAHGTGAWLARGRRMALLGGALAAIAFVDFARVQTFGGQPRGKWSEGFFVLRTRGWWLGDVPARLREGFGTTSGLALLEHVPPGETLCLRDVGLVGYESMNPIWDTAGLFTPTAAAARHDDRPETIAALFEDLRRADPALIELKRIPSSAVTIDDRVAEWLATDPEARERYVRMERRGTEGVGVTREMWLRRDLVPEGGARGP